MDRLSTLSPELKEMILRRLERKDVANLRLASREFTELPQTYFRQLVETKMPWMWELNSVEWQGLDWYKLWCKLSAADGGPQTDAKERKWKRDLRRGAQKELYAKLEREGKHPAHSSVNYQDLVNERWPVMEQEVAARIEAGYKAGMWPPQNGNVLLGLRNRRRIYQDIEEILRRIDALDQSKDH